MCYRTGCQEPCDEMKKIYCIMKITKEQKDFMSDMLDKDCCQQCGDRTVKAKYKGVEIDLCVSCGVLNNIQEGVS